MTAWPSSEHPLVRYLQSITSLSDAAQEALAHIPMQVVNLKTDQDIVRESDHPTRSCLILEGFAISFKVTGEGKRQIIAYHLPGDIPDLQSLHLTVLDTSVGTITPCKVGFITHETLYDLCAQHSEVASALWRWTLISAATSREWVTNNGRREAIARIAHLLCEMLVRMKAIGLAEDHSCEMAMTQSELADATGVSTVHVNRTLQELRGLGLISLRGSALRALDWEGLKRAGDFDPTYLHLRDRAAFVA
jgi:CRP-like cAMP-binding protein